MPRSRSSPSPSKSKSNATPALFDPVVYAPVFMGLCVLLIGALFDPKRADAFSFSTIHHPPVDVAHSWRLILSPLTLILWGCIAYGVRLEQRATLAHRLDRRERFALIWALCNAFWFHTGADVCSGLFGITPNLSETYKILNKDHRLPMHHPERVVMDTVYWFELLVEAPLALVVFYLFYKRDKSRYIVESWLHGMHLGGAVAYYVPDMILGETTHPVISNLDRCIAFTWVWVPALLVADAVHKSRLSA